MARKKLPPPTPEEYGLQRVLYNTLLAAQGHELIGTLKTFGEKEDAKAGGLIMARNLDDFFFKRERAQTRFLAKPKNKGKTFTFTHEPDDIFWWHYKIPSWKPDSTAMIDDAVYIRINKIIGHIVSQPQESIVNVHAKRIIKRLVKEAVGFIIEANAAGVDHKRHAGDRIKELNGVLAVMKLPQIPS